MKKQDFGCLFESFVFCTEKVNLGCLIEGASYAVMKQTPDNLIEALRFACDGAPHRAEERRGEGASVAGTPMGDKRRAVEPWRTRHAQRPSARRFFSRGNWGVGGTKPVSGGLGVPLRKVEICTEKIGPGVPVWMIGVL